MWNPAPATARVSDEAKVVLFDFSDPAAAGEWVPVNDVVMGGASTGGLESAGTAAVFRGEVSLDNHGGFASVRSLPALHDLSRRRGIALRLRGDGQRYKLNLKVASAPDDLLYRAVLQPAPGVWEELRFPFGRFVPTFRGRIVPDAPPLDLSRITSVGLMISDRQVGPFRLEIASITAY